MEHRHLNHSRYTLAAIDDIIDRGRLDDWTELRDALPFQPEMAEKIRRVCAAHTTEPRAQRYHFWLGYVDDAA